MSNNVMEVTKLGQSIWLDNIQRRSLENGELKEQIEQSGIRGVTSNPSIFNNAISNSNDYDNELKKLAANGLNSLEIFWKLAIADIQSAADLFRPLYNHSFGQDGFVSLEVNPEFAYNPQATLSEAERLWTEVDRPNLMIKIPATSECIPVIRNAIALGINVNVTLIFSLKRYEAVIKSYIQGLQDRVDMGKPIADISSVASFFISRMDTKLEPKLPDDSIFHGQVAIANAKLAFLEFQKQFLGKDFYALKEKGGQFQRPLWASTSTKNNKYPDTLYVDELIGPHTVNTVPPATLEAFLDHGTAKMTIEQGIHEARQTLNGLESLGISMDQVTEELEAEGVEAFILSFHELLEAIGRKMD